MAKKTTKKVTRKKTRRKKSSPAADQFDEFHAATETPYLPLSNLQLDGSNPRLGANAGHLRSQVEILDAVVDVFGIDDVLSSLAVNGYFEAEPMVGVRIEGAP